MTPPDELDMSRRSFLLAGGATVASAMIPLGMHGQTSPTSPIASGALTQVSLQVNGRARSLSMDTRTTLLDALLDHLHLTGTKKGCDHGQCGACPA